jgi:hypothetical protein
MFLFQQYPYNSWNESDILSLYVFDMTGSNFNANGNMNMKIRVAYKQST